MHSGHSPLPFWRRPAFALVLLPILVLLLNWPYLTGGFQGDDYIFLNLLEEDPLPFSRWRGLWSVNDYPFMNNFWWRDWEDPGEGGIFWRPLPSLVIEGSLRLFGPHAFPLHLLSILLHGGVAIGIYLLVRMLTRRHGLALLAGIFFVCCEDHSMGVGWISTITDPFCVLFILLALLGHGHWLRHRSLLAMGGSLLALSAAMVCKETAAVAPVALLLLTFFMPEGSGADDAERAGFRQRLLRMIKDPVSWLPSVLVLGAYLWTYRAMGLGALNTLVYINPIVDPGRFLAHMVPHLPLLWLGTFSPLPLFTTLFLQGIILPLAVLGLLIFILWLGALWPFRNRSLVLWALAVYLVALLPQLSTDASERGLYFPMVPASILMACVVCTIGPFARRMVLFGTATRWTRCMGWVALVGVLVPGALLSATMPWCFLPGATRPQNELGTARSEIEQSQPDHILILNTSGPMLTLYAWDILNHRSKRPLDVWVLSSACGVFSLERSGDTSFILRTDRAGWLDNIFVRIFRTREKLKPGRRYERPPFTATLETLTKRKRDVLEVRFDLKRPMSDPGWLFLFWNGEAFKPLDMAALPEGERMELADTSDVWKAMF